MIWADDSLFVWEPAWSQGLNARAPMIYLHNYCIFRFAHNEQQRMILGLHKNQLSLLCWAREMLRTGVRRGAVSQYYPDNPSFKGYTFPLQIGKVGTDCEAQKHLSCDNQASLLGWWQDLPVTHPESAWAWHRAPAGHKAVTPGQASSSFPGVSAVSSGDTRGQHQTTGEDRGQGWRHWEYLELGIERERENILATCNLWVEGGGLPLNLIDF